MKIESSGTVFWGIGTQATAAVGNASAALGSFALAMGSLAASVGPQVPVPPAPPRLTIPRCWLHHEELEIMMDAAGRLQWGCRTCQAYLAEDEQA